MLRFAVITSVDGSQNACQGSAMVPWNFLDIASCFGLVCSLVLVVFNFLLLFSIGFYGRSVFVELWYFAPDWIELYLMNFVVCPPRFSSAGKLLVTSQLMRLIGLCDIY